MGSQLPEETEVTMKRANVKKIAESKTGLNTKVSINGITYSNIGAYNKAKKGNVPGYCGVKNSNGTKFIRSNPDKSKSNNID